MSIETYRFKIGRFECIAVSDGILTYTPPTFPPPASLLFANAPREPLEQVLQVAISPARHLQPERQVRHVLEQVHVEQRTARLQGGRREVRAHAHTLGSLTRKQHGELHEILPMTAPRRTRSHAGPDGDFSGSPETWAPIS